MTVVEHVIESITPASRAHAEAARQAVVGAAAPMLERLASALGAAQHTGRPRGRRTIVVFAGDHAAGDPGIRLGPSHPTIVTAHAIADGSAALCGVARAAGAPIVLVDAGVDEPQEMPVSAVRLEQPGLEAGIALAVSLVDTGVDVIAVGAIGLGSEIAAAALLGAATGDRDRAGHTMNRDPAGVGDRSTGVGVREAVVRGTGVGVRKAGVGDREAEEVWAQGIELGVREAAARFGGPETAMLAGLMLSAASMNVPVILDSYATGAAALVAAALAPAVIGYLVAAHTGTLWHSRILAQLGIAPVFEVGLGHGEGTGAAMVLPLIDQVVALAAKTSA